MNQRSPLIKSLVLLSSVLLVGGYVVYSGAGDIMPGSKSGRIVGPSTMPTTSPSSQPDTVLAPVPTQPAVRFFPGSKSTVVVRPDEADRVITIGTPTTKPQNEAVQVERKSSKP
jgi:hypothetical protein